MRSRYTNLLDEKIAEEITKLQRGLEEGAPRDFADYRYHTGALWAFRLCMELAVEVDRQMGG